MTCILPNIPTLLQYLQTQIEQLKPDRCPHCGQSQLWNHGHYDRKVGRTEPEYSLTPIPIYRFLCTECNKTCSVLPECIPPRRWYLWCIQQLIILHIAADGSLNAASQVSTPSRSTCRRWWGRLCEQFLIHAHALRTQFTFLGRYSSSIQAFWSTCLKKITFDKAMFICHQQGVVIP